MTNSDMNQTATAIAPPEAPKKHKAATSKGKPGARKAKLKKSAKRTSPDGETKAGTILHMIGRAKGATLAELMKATGWQAHSVRWVSLDRRETPRRQGRFCEKRLRHARI